MTPEASRFLDKARKLLEEAETMLGIGLNEAAGRTIYLAGFHAAQAFIYESVGKIFKSHKGVQIEFLRLTKDDPRFTPDQRIFLSRTFNLKRLADYEAGPGSDLPAERAALAVEAGKKFVAHVAQLLSLAPPIQEPWD